MWRHAAHLRAHAIVAVRIDYEMLDPATHAMLVSAYGTAVRLAGGKPPEPEKRTSKWRETIRKRKLRED